MNNILAKSSRPNKKLIRAADSPSLWNFTLSPGWKHEEIEILRLAIMKFGLGAWSKITKSNCLPGKTPSQLNLQTQRIMGQQSLGEFMGIHLDCREVWQYNNQKQGEGFVRKNGCLINTGNNPTKEETRKKIEENRKRFGKAREEADAIVLPVGSTYVAKEELTRSEKKLKLRELKDLLRLMEDRLADMKHTGVFNPDIKPIPTAVTVRPPRTIRPVTVIVDDEKVAPKAPAPRPASSRTASKKRSSIYDEYEDDDSVEDAFEDIIDDDDFVDAYGDDDSDFESFATNTAKKRKF